MKRVSSSLSWIMSRKEVVVHEARWDFRRGAGYRL